MKSNIPNNQDEPGSEVPNWAMRAVADLAKAFEKDEVAVLKVKRRSDGKDAFLICIHREGTKMSALRPIAMLIEGSPLEQFEPPVQTIQVLRKRGEDPLKP